MLITSIASLDDVLDTWVLSEAPRLDKWLSAEMIDRLVSGAADENDRRLARYALFMRRRPVLTPYLSYPTRWYLIRQATAGLRDMRSYLFLDEGYETLGELADRRLDMTIPNFDANEVRGMPVFVRASSTEPVYLLEGAHRCCEMIRQRSVRYVPSYLMAYLGLCPRLGEIVAEVKKEVRLEPAAEKELESLR